MHDWWWLCTTSFMAYIHFKCFHQQQIDATQCESCISKSEKVKDAKQFLNKRNQYLRSILQKDVDQVMAVSDYLKSYLDKHIAGLVPIAVNANGVEVPEKIHTPVEHPIVRLGFMGGIQGLKGYTLLNEASQLIQATNWELYIYSVPTVDKEGFKKVWTYLKHQGIKGTYHKVKQVIKARYQPRETGKVITRPAFATANKEEVFAAIDILLSLSTVKESSSLVVIEALVRHIPVITTDSG